MRVMPIITTPPDWMKYRDANDDTYNYKAKIILGTNVYHRRKYRGLSQQELAQNAKTTQSAISEIEADEGNPSMDILSRIASALAIKVELLTKEYFDRQFFESLDYFISHIPGLDILKLMKLIYFTDLESEKRFGHKLTRLQYIRRFAGPFVPDIYIANDFFSKKGEIFIQKSQIKKRVALTRGEEKFLDKMIEKYGALSSTEIRDLSYSTPPMKGCTLRGNEKMGEKIL